jgi:hypothetical protein
MYQIHWCQLNCVVLQEVCFVAEFQQVNKMDVKLDQILTMLNRVVTQQTDE